MIKTENNAVLWLVVLNYLCRAKWRLWSVPDQIAGSMCLAVVSAEVHLSTMDLDNVRCKEEG